MHELLETLQGYHVAEGFILLGVLLVLIDYYFPTDVPAHFGYFCFGAGMFFLVPLSILSSAAFGLGVWIALALLHQIWFKRFLTNAPGVERRSTIEAIEPDEESEPIAESK